MVSFIWTLPPDTGVLRPLRRPLCKTLTYVAGNQPIWRRLPRACSSPSHQPESVFFRIIINWPLCNDNCSVLVASYGAITWATSPFLDPRKPCIAKDLTQFHSIGFIAFVWTISSVCVCVFDWNTYSGWWRHWATIYFLYVFFVCLLSINLRNFCIGLLLIACLIGDVLLDFLCFLQCIVGRGFSFTAKWLHIIRWENASSSANGARPPVAIFFRYHNIFANVEYEIASFSRLIWITWYVTFARFWWDWFTV